jgi:hypothetical protein
MSDDLDKKIQQIAEMLGQDKVPDNLKSLVSLLAGSLNSKESNTGKASEEEPSGEEKAVQNVSEDNPETASRVKKLIDGINTGNDPRINLLHAIKPFMSSKRQKKIGKAIQLLQMTSLARLINNNDK